ncbi:MAG: T9SS type A sorting domain-containing protein [Bacteroidota bacterium]
MKTLFFSFFVLLFSISNAQDYIPMLEENHTWSVDFKYGILPPGCEPNCDYIITEQITVADEVVVDGKTYKKVFTSNGATSCLVREENGIVYQLDASHAVEIIKYDFTLEVGDVFSFDDLFYCPLEDGSGFGGPFEVIDVSTQFIAGEDRKVIEFDFNFGAGINEVWIEGIGSITGFDPIGTIIDITDYSLLACFDIAGTNYFFNNATSCDNTTLGLNNFGKNEAVLYPNPVTHTSILQLAKEAQFDALKVYDANGKLIKEEKITSDYLLIEAMEYPTGLYFYQLIYKKGVIKAGKFIID